MVLRRLRGLVFRLTLLSGEVINGIVVCVLHLIEEAQWLLLLLLLCWLWSRVWDLYRLLSCGHGEMLLLACGLLLLRLPSLSRGWLD